MAVMWRRILHEFLGVSLTLVVLTICFAYFAIGLATRSHPEAYAISRVPVSDTVRVFRNSFGIPHILASSDVDVVFGQAWVHAQDRMWQMDVWRRTARGRLAELFGISYAPVDAFLRSMDLVSLSESVYRQLPSKSRAFLQAYSNGVNAFLAQNTEKLAFEFDALGYQPDPWTPEDCILVSRILALYQSPALWNDVSFAMIAAQRGTEAMRLYVPTSPNGPYCLDTTSAPAEPYTPLPVADTVVRSVAQASKQLTSILRNVQAMISLPSTSSASNGWAVGRGDDGAIVANDPHLGVALPSRWYQIHLTSPTLNVTGISIPGFPFVVAGRNDSLAWGITSAMVDDIDYAIERVDQTNTNYYLDHNSKPVKFQFRRDTIRVRNAADSLIDLRFTARGCVVSDALPAHVGVRHTTSTDKSYSAYLSVNCLTMKWTGRFASDEVGCLYALNQSARISQAHEAFRGWGAPALVINVGEANGSVGMFAAGFVPARVRVDPLLPHVASDTTASWRGVVRLTDRPPRLSGRRGMVASANNRLSANGTMQYGILSEPSSRIDRIHDQLRVYREMTVRDAQVLQQDLVSLYAASFTKKIVPVLQRATNRFSETERSALNELAAWDGSMTPISVAASIHAALLQKMMYYTFQDELGTPLYEQWVGMTNIPLRRVFELLDEPLHPLFDDLRTPVRENLSWIAIRSFTEALKDLTTTFGTTDITQWQWYRLHTVTFPHPMGSHQLLQPVVNSGPYNVGGSSTTLFNTEWDIRKPYATTITSSAKIISDLSDSVQYSVVPGGSSGQALHGHYTDQMQLWLKGGYVRIPVRRRPDITFRLFHVLTPDSVPLPNT